jgi:hypothetical protein
MAMRRRQRLKGEECIADAFDWYPASFLAVISMVTKETDCSAE